VANGAAVAAAAVQAMATVLTKALAAIAAEAELFTLPLQHRSGRVHGLIAPGKKRVESTAGRVLPLSLRRPTFPGPPAISYCCVPTHFQYRMVRFSGEGDRILPVLQVIAIVKLARDAVRSPIGVGIGKALELCVRDEVLVDVEIVESHRMFWDLILKELGNINSESLLDGRDLSGARPLGSKVSQPARNNSG